MSGRKKSAILVGCDYYGTQYERHGCRNDVRLIEEVLARFGFRPENISRLIETDTPDLPNQPTRPTMANIRNALNKMKSEARVGDVLFFYFSGLVKVNPSNNIPAIFSCDLKHVSAAEFRYEDNPLPTDANFTVVLESSNSVGFLNPVANDNNRILFSACQANETAARVVYGDDISNTYGAFTKAINVVFGDEPTSTTNQQLLTYVNRRIQNFNQHASLACNDNNKNAPFIDYIVSNN